MLGSLTASLFTMLIFILATIFIIPMEGKRLENCYGEEYRAYKQRVRRWF